MTQQQEIAATRLALGQPCYVPITSRSTFLTEWPWAVMPAYVEVWCEKDACAMRDIPYPQDEVE